MQKEALLPQIQEIFRDVLDDEEVILTESSTAEDVEGWDSLTHIQLIVAIEKQFKVKFTSREILSWKDVGELIDCLALKLA